MNRIYFLALCLCWALLGCINKASKSSTENQVEKETKMVNTFPEVDLHKKYAKKQIILQDIADVEYVAIETNETALLVAQHFSNTIWNDDIMIIHTQDAILFFDNTGKYLHSFNRLGGSGEEYHTITSVGVDYSQKEVFVYDFRGAGNMIFVYSFDGKFKYKLEMPDKAFYTAFLYNLNQDYLFTEDVYNVDLEGIEVHNNTPYHKISKKDGKISKLPLTIPKRIRDQLRISKGELYIGMSIGISPIVKNGPEIIISDFGLDTVYSFRDDILTPIAIRKNRISKDGNPILATVQIKTDRYLLWDVIEKNIAFDINTGKASNPDPYRLIYDKYTGECYQAEIINMDGITDPDDMDFRLKLKRGKDIPENYAIRPYAAEFLVGLYKEGKLKGRLKEIASTLKDDDNPILMVVKFKE